VKTCSRTGTLRPLTAEFWRSAPFTAQDSRPTRAWMHRFDRLVVLSSYGPATAPDGTGDVIPQWHLSIVARADTPVGQEPVRCTAEQLTRFVETFGLTEFEIDNHHPGAAQHFWIPRDPARRVDCECKSDETIIVEPDGYTWTNPVDGPCRGCDYKRMSGRPCPIHVVAS
jgi:hypothetical protein